ncbi:MAG: type I-C CRISPR-associated protein Cas8c/Csd1 [Clostridiaceae bacterium]|nr:type I-C CRISPR-associated protein Cas8c/Csd1 [Clostridiaceae bacterium]
MLIKALCDYYDVNEKKIEKSESEGFFSTQQVSFMIFLSKTGEITSILDIRKEEKVPAGKDKTKTIYKPTDIRLPKRSQKTGIDLNIIEHRPLYIFGLNYDKKNCIFTPNDDTHKAEKSHNIFVKGNLDFCDGIDSDIVVAYRNFLMKWEPAEQLENPHLIKIAKDYLSSYYCFALEGDERILLHKDEGILNKYVKQAKDNLDDQSTSVNSMCPIEGDHLPTARIHEKIKGIKGGNPVGSVLVGVKNSAFESYGKSQGYNSSISEIAMKKYTSVLNGLLADKNHHLYLEELTIVFFAIDTRDEDVSRIFAAMLSGTEESNLENGLSSMSREISQGRVGDVSALKTNEHLMFYVTGLTPNSSRISQKFIIKDDFGRILKNLSQHQKDLQIKEVSKQLPVWKLTKELVSPKSRDGNAPSSIISALFFSILNGTNYPVSLLETAVRRVKTDSDDDKSSFIKINDTRISIIKACLNRKARINNEKEEITMTLDQGNTNQAYLCGRLFAVLEFIQQRASGGGLNRTIKDAYFSSACVRPATVFPKLVMLAQHHLAKIDGAVYFEKMMGSIMASLNGEFPQTLSLDDQGKFIIGYYQQNNSLYTKKTETQD